MKEEKVNEEEDKSMEANSSFYVCGVYRLSLAGVG
jgi:hypothetical protein